MLTVTAQQSRFHNEAIEGSALKAVIVKDLSVSVGAREVLSHAELQLQVGKHYVLVGRNGIGKSTLLKAIAGEQIPSIPHSLRVLLLGQTESGLHGDLDGLALEEVEESVLQHVVRSDKARERLVREERVLSTAIENAREPTAAVQAYRRISHERLEQKVFEAGRIAKRRSGARGKEATKVLIRLEEELKESEVKLNQVPRDIDAAEMGQESQKAADLLMEVQSSLELMDASGAEARARSILLGLGFSQESIEQPTARLSGGWRTRCSLACALCQSSDLLLLDEPTNFLDLPSVIWLERYIQTLGPSTTVVVVTHDRAFVDGVADELLVMRNLGLERFRGNLSSYELERVKTWKHMTRMKETQEKQKQHMQSSVESNIRAAKRAGDDKKLKQAASRKKKLDERMGLQVSARGGRFKLTRDLAGYHLSKRADIEVPDFDPPVTLAFPTDVADLRFPGALVSFEKVCFAYKPAAGGAKKEGAKQVLRDVDLTIHLGERVGIAGLNGSGKSTLVSLATDTAANKPTNGTVTRHPRARVGLYSQHAVDELDALGARDGSATALSHLMQTAGADQLADKDARGLLRGVGLAGKTASEVPISQLSGGQKVRLALAKLLWTPPHLLILDEVTTHLDSDTVEGLAVALRRYRGAVLVVTHDRFFMRCVVEGESPREFARSLRPGGEDGEGESDDESDDSEEEEGTAAKTGTVYRLSKGRLTKLDDGMRQYEDVASRATSKLLKV